MSYYICFFINNDGRLGSVGSFSFNESGDSILFRKPSIHTRDFLLAEGEMALDELLRSPQKDIQLY